jgi:hypothetical protein
MEAVVLGTVIAFSLAIAVAAAWSALATVMYLIDVSVGMTALADGTRVTETPILPESPVTAQRPLAA